MKYGWIFLWLGLLPALAQAQGTIGLPLNKGAGMWAFTIPELMGKTFVNVKAFGAVGDGNADDTVAIQAAIDSVERPFATLSGLVAHGGIVYFPPGYYRIGNYGGRCSAGGTPGKACKSDADCVGGVIAGVCAAIQTGRVNSAGVNGYDRGAVVLLGAGPPSSELVMRCGALPDCAGVSAIAVTPLTYKSQIIGLDVVKRTSDILSTGHGIVIQAHRVSVIDTEVHTFGGHGIFVDGVTATGKANSGHFERLLLEGNGRNAATPGSGMYIYDHSDGSAHVIDQVITEANKAYGIHVYSSWSDMRGVQTNGNLLGGVYFEAGTGNVMSAYCETATQPFCYKFAAAAVENTYVDLSNSVRAIPSVGVDLGEWNSVKSAGREVTSATFLGITTIPDAVLTRERPGSRVYCRDCDRPVGVGDCTSAGAKAGAFAHWDDVSTKWRCEPI